jgi:crotonobetainyl-CoA:carnitine CoA-transferase CaiB-like acyl-CoA transferase
MPLTTDAPLAGIRVIELARILAAPWAGQVLADLGADVIKVEQPGRGDDTRHWGPPFVTGPENEDLGAAYYHACNRGKRSIAVDIATSEGQQTIRRLAASADVLIENFKVGGLAKYGLDAASLRSLNPRLVYCSITGFGQSGPYAGRAGYDVMIQGMSGIMALIGEPDGEPMKMGVAFADIFTGLYATIAIQAALAGRAQTGNGAFIDMALLDAMVAVLANQAMNYLVTGREPPRLGNAHPNVVPYEVFPACDGHVIVAVGNDRQFREFCRLLGHDDLAGDARFATNADRVENREGLIPVLKAATAKWPAAELLAALEAGGVPAGPINGLAAIFADPQIAARQLVIERSVDGVTVPGLRTPIMLDGRATAAARPAPRLGQHSEEILAELASLEDGK